MHEVATNNDCPVLTLENGIRVANFSSPHAFTFVSGETLPACSPERCRRLSAVPQEVEVSNPRGWTDIELSFELGPDVRAELERLDSDDDIDVVIAPLPIVQAARSLGLGRKARTVRMADRVTKVAHSDRFCV